MTTKILIVLIFFWVFLVAIAAFKNQPIVVTSDYVGASVFWSIAPPFVAYSVFKYLRWMWKAFMGRKK